MRVFVVAQFEASPEADFRASNWRRGRNARCHTECMTRSCAIVSDCAPCSHLEFWLHFPLVLPWLCLWFSFFLSLSSSSAVCNVGAWASCLCKSTTSSRLCSRRAWSWFVFSSFWHFLPASPSFLSLYPFFLIHSHPLSGLCISSSCCWLPACLCCSAAATSGLLSSSCRTCLCTAASSSCGLCSASFHLQYPILWIPFL